MPAVVLASASAARARLLGAAGVAFDTIPAAIDEAALRAALRAEGASAGDAAIALAELKATRVASASGADVLVLGSDQILTLDGDWLEKPADLAAARRQLDALNGRRHELWTAAVGVRDGRRVWHVVREARLWLRPCSAAFLDAYVARMGEALLGSLGAYHVEGSGAQLFARIDGDLFAIQGLPLLDVLEFLRGHGALER